MHAASFVQACKLAALLLWCAWLCCAFLALLTTPNKEGGQYSVQKVRLTRMVCVLGALATPNAMIYAFAVAAGAPLHHHCHAHASLPLTCSLTPLPARAAWQQVVLFNVFLFLVGVTLYGFAVCYNEVESTEAKERISPSFTNVVEVLKIVWQVTPR